MAGEVPYPPWATPGALGFGGFSGLGFWFLIFRFGVWGFKGLGFWVGLFGLFTRFGIQGEGLGLRVWAV